MTTSRNTLTWSQALQAQKNSTVTNAKKPVVKSASPAVSSAVTYVSAKWACMIFMIFILIILAGLIGFGATYAVMNAASKQQQPSSLTTYNFSHTGSRTGSNTAQHRTGDVAIHASGVGATYYENREVNIDTLPRTLDYRTVGAITPVKNQGSCAACWAVSSTEAIESAFFLKYNHLQIFSIQQTTQCSTLDVVFPIMPLTNLKLTLRTITQFGTRYALYMSGDYSIALVAGTDTNEEITLSASDVAQLNLGSDVTIQNVSINRNNALNLIQLGEKQAVLAGCGGGAPHAAMEYLKTHALIPSELYPYEWRFAAWNLSCSSPYCQAGCQMDRMTTYADLSAHLRLPTGYSVKVQDWGYVYPCWHTSCAALWSYVNVSRIVHALDAYGPLVVTINAQNWVRYTGGVVKEAECSSDPSLADHSVLLVGYDLDNEFFIVRNSWGAFWGENGYIRLSTRDNACGLSNFALHVSVVSDYLR